MFEERSGGAAEARAGGPSAADPTRCTALLDDGSGLDGAHLISRIGDLERAKAACAAEQARLTARFVASQAAAAARLRDAAQACSDAGDFDGWVAARDEARARELAPTARDEPGRARRRSRSARRATLSRTGVSAQVGLARHESPSRGARLANASVALVRDLPHTLAALSAGILNERRAELVVRGTSHLTPEMRSLVDAEVIGANIDPDDDMAPGGVASWGDREVERRVRACADHLDAAAAVERTRLAESQRRVSIRPVPDAMATVTALLPVAQAVAVHAALTQAALAGKAAGDERGKGQLMADTLVERVTGQTAADDVALEVQVVISDHALVAGVETPAHVAGYGPVPSAWVRDLLTRHLRRRTARLAKQGHAQPPPGCAASTPTPSPAPSSAWTAPVGCFPPGCAASSSPATAPAAPRGATRRSPTPTTSPPTHRVDRRACPTGRASASDATSSRRSAGGVPECSMAARRTQRADRQAATVTRSRTPSRSRPRPATATGRPRRPSCSQPPPLPASPTISSETTAPEVDVGRSGRPAGTGAIVIELYRHHGLEVELTA